jgi:hypothetical protein
MRGLAIGVAVLSLCSVSLAEADSARPVGRARGNVALKRPAPDAAPVTTSPESDKQVDPQVNVRQQEIQPESVKQSEVPYPSVKQSSVKQTDVQQYGIPETVLVVISPAGGALTPGAKKKAQDEVHRVLKKVFYGAAIRVQVDER